MNKNDDYPSEDQPWRIETNGINAIPESERHGTPLELFWIWFASDLGVIAFVYGGILVSMRLNLWQAALALLLGTGISFALVGILSFTGPQTGLPMLTLSRSSFGMRGNIAPALCSWVTMLGWEIASLVLSAYALLDLLNLLGLPNTLWTTSLCLFVSAGLLVGLGLLGHATLVRIEYLGTIGFGVFALLVCTVLVRGTNWALVVSTPPGPWGTGFLAAVSILAAATGLTWLNASSDYTRYLPRKSSRSAILLWTILGAVVPIVSLCLVGFLLVVRVPSFAQAANPVAALQALLPGWLTFPFLLMAILTPVIAGAMCLYSSGLSLLALGVHMQRSQAIGVDGFLMVAASAYILVISRNFLNSFESFLELVTVGLTAWAAVLLVDMARGRWRNEQQPSAGGWRQNIAIVTWLVGLIVGLLFTASPLFSGPLATGIIALANGGYFIGFLVTFLLYALSLFFQEGCTTGKTVEVSEESERDHWPESFRASEEKDDGRSALFLRRRKH